MSKQEEYPFLFRDEENINIKKKQRHKEAMKIAKKVSRLLKKEYNANVVWVFGSLNDPDRFNQWSDIDLAVQGIPSDKFYSAVGAVTGLFKEFKIDLIDLDDCKKSLAESVIREGEKI